MFLANAEHKDKKKKWSQTQDWSNLKCFIPGVWRSRVCGCGGKTLTAINVLNNGGTKRLNQIFNSYLLPCEAGKK